MKTAFRATVKSGKPGPRIAFLCEYDGLPVYGQSCGHNVVAAAGVGAAIGLAKVVDRIGGEAVALGTPGEEGGGGKNILHREGFFDGIDPSMEHAALIDGCTRWGAFLRVALPSAIPAIAALAVLCWLFTWNEFLFALILTGNKVPVITVVMAQFVTEMGLRWNLMAATAVLALVTAFLLALFGQKYVIRGLRI